MKPEDRWKYGSGYYRQPLMMSAIHKYGWNNIKHEILYDGLTKEEAERKEIELIAEYQSNKEEFGYNIANGGNTSGTHSESSKKKMSDARKGKGNPNYGKHHSEETKRKIGEASKKKRHSEETKKKISESISGEKNPFYGKSHSEESKQKNRNAHLGKHHTEETKRKMSEQRQGEGAYWYGKHLSESAKRKLSVAKSKPVRCIETGVIYYGQKEAGKQTGIDKASIGRCCRGNQKTAGGFHWEYVEEKNEVSSIKL